MQSPGPQDSHSTSYTLLPRYPMFLSYIPKEVVVWCALCPECGKGWFGSGCLTHLAQEPPGGVGWGWFQVGHDNLGATVSG